MPTSTRRQAHRRLHSQGTVDTSQEVHSDAIVSQETVIEQDVVPDEEMEDEEVIEVEDEEEEEEVEEESPVFPPPGLKEISSLASWTVSTAKPGNGVAALRSPDLAHFWQSDGPQPHLLSIHFFKLVSIASIRVFLDFEHDESYTPTKIQFLAGMGLHDIQEFSEMSFEQPNGWKEVDFSNVGPIEPDDDSDEENQHETDWSKRPLLRAFILQVRILENHQNGKDTHLRSVQVFARDEVQQPKTVGSRPKQALSALPTRRKAQQIAMTVEPNNIKLASWMMEPDLR